MTDLGFKPRQSGFRATAVSHHTILLSLLPTYPGQKSRHHCWFLTFLYYSHLCIQIISLNMPQIHPLLSSPITTTLTRSLILIDSQSLTSFLPHPSSMLLPQWCFWKASFIQKASHSMAPSCPQDNVQVPPHGIHAPSWSGLFLTL